MRIACVLITHLRAKAELRRHAHLRDSPIAVVDSTDGKPLVVDSSAGASARAGMTLEQATPATTASLYSMRTSHTTGACSRMSQRRCFRSATAWSPPNSAQHTRAWTVWSFCTEARRKPHMRYSTPFRAGSTRACRSGRLEVHIVHSGTDRRCAKCCRLPCGRSRLPRSPVHRASAAVRRLEEVAARLRRPHDGTGGFSFPRHAGRPLRTRGHSCLGAVQRHRQASCGPAQGGDINHGIRLTAVRIDLH